MRKLDPELPFKIGRMNRREARESGLSLKPWVGHDRRFLSGVPKGSDRPKRRSISSFTEGPTVPLDTLPQLSVALEIVGARILC